MEDSKDGNMEQKMKMWKMKDEMLNAMSDKELRAFIKGYMMAERMVYKQINAMSGCNCERHESSSCGCGNKDCNCGKE